MLVHQLSSKVRITLCHKFVAITLPAKTADPHNKSLITKENGPTPLIPKIDSWIRQKACGSAWHTWCVRHMGVLQGQQNRKTSIPSLLTSSFDLLDKDQRTPFYILIVRKHSEPRLAAYPPFLTRCTRHLFDAVLPRLRGIQERKF